MHVRTKVTGPTSQEENNELMALSLDLLDEKRGAARLRNWSYQQDVARTIPTELSTPMSWSVDILTETIKQLVTYLIPFILCLINIFDNFKTHFSL